MMPIAIGERLLVIGERHPWKGENAEFVGRVVYSIAENPRILLRLKCGLRFTAKEEEIERV